MLAAAGLAAGLPAIAAAQTICSDVGSTTFCTGPDGPATANTIGGTTWSRPIDNDLLRRIDADIRRGSSNRIGSGGNAGSSSGGSQIGSGGNPISGSDRDAARTLDTHPVAPPAAADRGTTFLNDGSGRLSICSPVGGIVFCN
ncbi:MAG: hypothetical protein AB7G13_28830 [Lautropia sp.]